MSSRIPASYIIMDERGAYLARYHQIMPSPETIRREVIRAYGSTCACCGHSDPYTMTIDHVKPVAQTGEKRKTFLQLWSEGCPVENIQLLCVACNQMKGSGMECPHKTFIRHLKHYFGEPEQATTR